MKISVCIPMYNEQDVIADTAKALSAYMAAIVSTQSCIFASKSIADSIATMGLFCFWLQLVKSSFTRGWTMLFIFCRAVGSLNIILARCFLFSPSWGR